MATYGQYVRTFHLLEQHDEHMHLSGVSDGMQMFAALKKDDPTLAVKAHVVSTETWNNVPGLEYRGPRLSFPLTAQNAEQLQSLVLHYAKDTGVHLHPHYLVKILSQAMEVLGTRPRVVQTQARSGQHKKLVVVGDLHGQLADLLTIFANHGLPSPAGTQYVFNGDFVDRGPHGVEIITLLLAYTICYPDTVHLNRGNHETEHVSMMFGFMDEVTQKYDRNLYNWFLQIFNLLPLCTVLDEAVVVVHGGLPRQESALLQNLEDCPRQEVDSTSTDPAMMLMHDLIWTDPMETPGIAVGKRGPDVVMFGPDVTARFLRENHKRLLIRSHQPPDNGGGVEQVHGGKCVTVFSASNYCGHLGNYGGVVVFDESCKSYRSCEYLAPPLPRLTEPIRRACQAVHEWAPVEPIGSAEHTSSSSHEQQASLKEHVLVQLHQLVARHRNELTAFYRQRDNGSGFVSVDTWSEGV